MEATETQNRCPKCGEPMYLLPYSCATNHGVSVCDAICKNCLHVEQMTFAVAKKGKQTPYPQTCMGQGTNAS